MASARADSAEAGTGTGDCSAESPLPTSPIRAPEAMTMTSAMSQDRRRFMVANYFR